MFKQKSKSKSDLQIEEVETIRGSHNINNAIHGEALQSGNLFDPLNDKFIQTKGLPTFIEGKLESKIRANPLKTSLAFTETEAKLVIANSNSDLEVHAAHLYRMTITSGKNGKKQLTRFLIARTSKINSPGQFNDRDGKDAHNKEPDWDKEKYPIPLVGHVIKKNEIVTSHMLIMNDLTINQTETLVVKSPKFIMNSCCYLDSNRNVKPINNISVVFKVLLLKKIQFYNNYLRNQAMTEEERSELRDQLKSINALNTRNEGRIQGVLIKVPQFQIDMFLEESIDNVMIETTGNSMIGRIGLCSSQSSKIVSGIEVAGSIENLMFKDTQSSIAQPFTNVNWYVTNKRSVEGLDDIKEDDIKWFKRSPGINSFGNYNQMVKPIWMKNVNNSSIFESVSINDIDALITANEESDKAALTKKLKSTVHGFDTANSDHAKLFKQQLQTFIQNKYNIRKMIISEALTNVGKYAIDAKAKIPAAKYFDGFVGFKGDTFDQDLKTAVDSDKGVLDLELKINGTPLTSDELIHIWESINVLHRTAAIRVRGFKV